MNHIDLEPHAYRETGRARLVRSILHKPVFMTISTVLGVWCAVTIGVVMQSKGFGRVPEWAVWMLLPSLAVSPAFLIFAALVDEDKAIPDIGTPAAGRLSRPSAQGRLARED